MRYDAFISYRHVDPDRAWARWLHRSLESYRVPRALREQGFPGRIGRVFRDEEELPASSDLSASIDEALRESRFLIVVCSRATPSSRWVDQEIVRFQRMGRGDRVLALLTDGEPEDAFPPSLRRVAPDARPGEASPPDAVEPLAADVRPGRHAGHAASKRLARLRLISRILGCRFDDLRQREHERQRRRAIAVGSVLVGLIALLSGLTVYALGQRSLAERKTADVERALADVMMLSNSKKVRDLVEEADLLWPVHPEVAPRMAAWTSRASSLLQQRSTYEDSLRRVRAQGREVREGGGTEWRFEDAELDWQHAVLSDMLEALRLVRDERAPDRGLLAQVEQRHAEADSLERLSLREHAGEWARTVEAIAASPDYGGLRIVPQLGLVPLGPDRRSRLFEFAHLGSGTVPARDPATGDVRWTEDAGIVLVLVPPRTFLMGAQKADSHGPNFDAAAQDDEGPVHEVRLSPFFLAKHECTQAQWRALTGGATPSQYRTGMTVQGRRLTLRNPVEQVSWDECERWTARRGLALPTEAQWECACRAGADEPWSTGRDVTRLGSVANVADGWFARHGGPANWKFTAEIDDGHAVHAPVGSYEPNALGFHDMHGNVYEWTRDVYAPYGASPATDPLGPPAAPDSVRVGRGGSWSDAAEGARSSPRTRDAPGTRNDSLGLRPARPCTLER